VLVVGAFDLNVGGLRGASGYRVELHPRVAANGVTADVQRVASHELPELFGTSKRRST
jgi:hypothetical protein